MGQKQVMAYWILGVCVCWRQQHAPLRLAAQGRMARTILSFLNACFQLQPVTVILVERSRRKRKIEFVKVCHHACLAGTDPDQEIPQRTTLVTELRFEEFKLPGRTVLQHLSRKGSNLQAGLHPGSWLCGGDRQRPYSSPVDYLHSQMDKRQRYYEGLMKQLLLWTAHPQSAPDPPTPGTRKGRKRMLYIERERRKNGPAKASIGQKKTQASPNWRTNSMRSEAPDSPRPWPAFLSPTPRTLSLEAESRLLPT